jgi:UDP-N-acetylglucosamine 2-epimerase (non-hydrolysing)
LCFPVHLNPEVRKVVFGALDALPNLRLIEPVDFESNLYLQSQCALIITDSGGIQEEAPSFGVPTVVLREHTERGEGIAVGFATLVGTNTQAIINTAEKYLMDAAGLQSLKLKPNPYGDGLASQRIISALLGQQVEPFNG